MPRTISAAQARNTISDRKQKGRSQPMHPSRLGRAMSGCVMMVVTMMMAGRGKGRRRNQHQQAGNSDFLHGLILAQTESTP